MTMCKMSGTTGIRTNSINLPHHSLWCGFLYALLLFLGVRSSSQQKISGNIVEFTQGHQVANRHFICAPFIPGVHSLGSSQHFRNLSLGQVVVFPQSPQLIQIHWHTFPRFSVCQQFNIVNNFTIDFSKYLY